MLNKDFLHLLEVASSCSSARSHLWLKYLQPPIEDIRKVVIRQLRTKVQLLREGRGAGLSNKQAAIMLGFRACTRLTIRLCRS